MTTPLGRAAARIRDELVCCDIYARVQRGELTLRQARKSRAWHDLCYWGEAAARIAEQPDRPTVIRRTPAELREQRARLIAESGLTYDQLAERASRALSPRQIDIWHTIEGIDYLLGGATRPDLEGATS